MKKITYLLGLFICVFHLHAQDYTITSIPYNLESFSNSTSVVQTDDAYSSEIPIGFDFEYFGDTYSSLAISDNGAITFSVVHFEGFDEWNFTENIPTATLPGNIFAPKQDMYLPSGGTVYYELKGTAPNRKFVITYDQVTLYYCTNLLNTSQVVLYEGTNTIDIIIQNTESCSGWNNGNKALGIQNNNGSIGYSPAGRNTSDSPWTANQEAWRFTSGANYSIVFNTFFDADTNGCTSDEETQVPIQFRVFNTEHLFEFSSNDFTNSSFPLYEGTYTVIPFTTNIDELNIQLSSTTITVSDANETATVDACVSFTTPNTNGDITLVPLEDPRPGFPCTYLVTYSNYGSEILSGSVQFTLPSDYASYQSSSTAYATTDGQNYQWDFTSLNPFESRSFEVTLLMNTPTDPNFPLNSGDILSIATTLTTDQTDENVENNSIQLEQTVVNSYDPNDITCLFGTTIAVDQVGEYAYYVIRFENEGTANATTVRIVNPIDTSKLDLSTYIPLHSSHAYTSSEENNAITFTFDAINLGTTASDNKGYVMYKIKTLTSLNEGDIFDNTASIYFDFNPAIATNVYETLINSNLSIESFEQAGIQLFPNPAKDRVVLQLPEDFREGNTSLVFYDYTGRKVLQKKIEYTNTSFSCASLSTGIYFIKVQQDDKAYTTKFIKK